MSRHTFFAFGLTIFLVIILTWAILLKREQKVYQNDNDNVHDKVRISITRTTQK